MSTTTTNACLCIDKLIFNLKQKEQQETGPFQTSHTLEIELPYLTAFNCLTEYIAGDFKLVREINIETPNAYLYNLKYHVYHKLIHFADIYTDLKDIKQNQPLVKFAVKNKALYTTDYIGILNAFTDQFNLTIHNVNAIDIALDTTNNLLKSFQTKYNNYKKYSFLVNRKNTNHVKTIVDRGNVFKYVVIDRNLEVQPTDSNSTKTKSVAIYNKTEEITKSEKHYISSYHTAQGLNTDQKVYRLELRLRSRELKRYSSKGGVTTVQDFNLTLINNLHSLTNQTYLLSIITHYLPSIFEFRKVGTDTNISRYPKVDFLKNVVIKSINIATTSLQPVIIKKPSISLKTHKMRLNSLYKMYQENESNYLLETAKKYAEETEQTDYFYNELYTCLDLTPKSQNQNIKYGIRLKTISVV